MTNNDDDEYENEGQEGTKTLNIRIQSKMYNRLKDYSRDNDKSLSSIVNEALNNEVTRTEVKAILTEKCESGKLPKSSRVCKAILEEEHY